ncbi:HD domain-containing protein [Puia sp.]|jgi:HD superfamily phosphodiesterase|uniref:HD domain-containing protein n=1 Tax=Puia sp. TaxID=2045100 RepID=UPI002F3F2678
MLDIDWGSIEKKITGQVTRAFDAGDAPHYPYHNLEHTQGVVLHCREIATHYSLAGRELFILIAAAWFHDIGHLYGAIEGHEERGVVLMRQYLCQLPRELTTAIATCIMATRLPSRPHSLSEQIICDADTYHLGTPLFRQTDPLVRREMELRTGMAMADWGSKTLTMLRRHVFFTDYCRTLLAKGKEENVRWVAAQLELR